MATLFYRWTAPNWVIVILFTSFFSIAGLEAAGAASDDPGGEGKGDVRLVKPPPHSDDLPEYHGLRLRFIDDLTGAERKEGEAPAAGEGPLDRIRLEALEAISDDGIRLAEEGALEAGAVSLVRLEPRRDDRTRVMRRVWKPWVRTMIDTLSFSGYVYYFYQKYYSEAAPDDEYNLTGINLKIGTKTYVWRPWFAILDGGVGVAADKMNSTVDDTTASHMTGDVNLTVFPTSRFPFRAGYSRDWSGSAGAYIGSNVATERYYARQQYQNRSGMNLFANYTHTATDTDYTYRRSGEDDMASKSVTDSVNLSASKSFDKHSVNFNANVNKNTQDTQNEAIDTATVIMLHKYTPDLTLSVDNNANVYNLHNSSSVTQAGKNVSFDNSRYIFQAISKTFYRPAGNKLLADAGLRYFGTLDESSISVEDGPTRKTTSDTGSANFFASATYIVNNNLDVGGSFNYNKTVIPSNGPSFSSQGLNVNYHSDEIDLWGARYSWNSNFSAQNQVGDQQSSLMLQPSVGHGINKGIGLGANSSLTASLNQNFSIVHYVRAAHGSYFVPYPQTQENIGHTASLAWNYRGERGAGGIRLSASDTRTRGVAERNDEQVTQLAYAQVNLDIITGRFSKIYMDWTVQYTRGTFTTEAYDERVNTRGFVSYRNLRVFGVRNLSFYSELRVADESFLLKFGDENQQETMSWENRLLYSIGKLELAGLYRVSEINTTRQDILMLRITRNFGN